MSPSESRQLSFRELPVLPALCCGPPINTGCTHFRGVRQPFGWPEGSVTARPGNGAAPGVEPSGKVTGSGVEFKAFITRAFLVTLRPWGGRGSRWLTGVNGITEVRGGVAGSCSCGCAAGWGGWKGSCAVAGSAIVRDAPEGALEAPDRDLFVEEALPLVPGLWAALLRAGALPFATGLRAGGSP